MSINVRVRRKKSNKCECCLRYRSRSLEIIPRNIREEFFKRGVLFRNNRIFVCDYCYDYVQESVNNYFGGLDIDYSLTGLKLFKFIEKIRLDVERIAGIDGYIGLVLTEHMVDRVRQGLRCGCPPSEEIIGDWVRRGVLLTFDEVCDLGFRPDPDYKDSTVYIKAPTVVEIIFVVVDHSKDGKCIFMVVTALSRARTDEVKREVSLRVKPKPLQKNRRKENHRNYLRFKRRKTDHFVYRKRR